jgi:hypothetical protein
LYRCLNQEREMQRCDQPSQKIKTKKKQSLQELFKNFLKNLVFKKTVFNKLKLFTFK